MTEIRFYQRNNYDLLVTVLVKGTSTPIDITSSEITFSVKSDVKDTTYVFQKMNTAAGGDDTEIEITDATNGVFQLKLIPADTADINSGGYVYDFEITLSNGKTYTLEEDALIIEENVTDEPVV